MARVYFHIDLNAFYANAEILLDPSLKGKPIAVSGQTRRSVISTASYEARTYGVHSAQPVQEALKRCPQLEIVSPHFHFYHELSRQFIDIVRSYTDEIEQASIDECYADMTVPISRFSHPLDLAVQLQKRVLSEVGIPCSIGVGPNMFLAKMASEMKKPLGITVLRIREAESKLWPLPIGDMRGVGAKTVPMLEELGIRTIGDLAAFKEPSQLRAIFGRNTDMMIRRANGYDDRTIVKEYDARSMGVSETLLEDITDYDELRGLIRTLSRKLSTRLKEAKKAGCQITLRIRYYDFVNTDRSRKLERPVWKADDLFVEAMRLFDDNWENEPVRLLGISVSGFPAGDILVEHPTLFDLPDSSREELEDVLRDLNSELGGTKLFLAGSLLKGKS